MQLRPEGTKETQGNWGVELVDYQRFESIGNESKLKIIRSVGTVLTCNRVQIVDPARPSVHQRRRDDEASAAPRKSIHVEPNTK